MHSLIPVQAALEQCPYHRCKNLHCHVDSTQHAEAIGTSRGTEIVDVLCEAAIAMGDSIEPVFVGTDNFSNALVASTWGTARTAKHFLRRYWTTLQRVNSGRVVIGHVPDPQNAADIFTKFVDRKKYAASIAFLTNRAAWRPPKPG